MPYRKPKRSFVIPVVTTLAVAAPLATCTLGDSTDYRSTTGSEVAAIPAQLAEVVLTTAPDITLPLRELTGLDLPDLHLSDLRMLPLPASIPIPEGLPLPPGVELPKEIPLPRLNPGQIAPTQNAPGQTFSGQNTPGQTTPSQTTPSQTAPGQTAYGQPVPGQTAPNLTAPAQNPAGQVAPTPSGRAPAAAFIADPSESEPGITPETPALAPGAVPPEMLNQVGAQVKELSRDTPFSVVALTAHDLANTDAMVRARQSDGGWGPWYDTEAVDTRRTDKAAAPATTGTEPIYVGNTNAVQILVTRKPAQSAPDAVPAPIRPTPAAAPHSDDPAQLSAAALTAVLIDPGRGAIDGGLSEVAAALPGGGPDVITRSQWGADESIRCEEPTYDDQLGGITVHHTAGRNDYTRAESAGIVRAIYAYHAKTLGWCDIGYNALVDKYGQVFEGRFGGLDRPVQGAHAGGFNENTSGVALMGNYESEEPAEEALDAIGRFVGWRAKIAGLNPKGDTTMYSEGTEYTFYAQGAAVRLPVVFAHRDVGNTSCPGDAAYAEMDRIREIAAGVAGSAAGTDKPQQQQPQQQQQRPQQQAPAEPRAQVDLNTLAALTGKLLGMANQNPIAKHWADKGGPDGPLGAAASEPLPAAQGQQYAKFVNGYVYTSTDGQVYEVLGAILDRFLALGADAGILGLPTTNTYPIPNGLRSDFQYGSLVLNQLTGIVTTVWKTFDDSYKQELASHPAGAVAAGPR